MMRHLTLTGLYAGRTVCGQSKDGAQAVHAVWAPEWMLTDADTCAACRHAWECESDPCETCDTITIAPVFPAMVTA
jgi:hypothetical protein